MNEQLRRIQFVTQYYDWLQGLRFLPAGLVLLGFAAWVAAAAPETGPLPRAALGGLGAGLTAALVLYAVLGRYYRRRFGDVRPSAAIRQTRWRMLLAFALAALVMGAGTVLLEGLAPGRQMPMARELMLGAASVVAYWVWTGRFVPHYPAIAGGMLVLASLHLWGLNPLCASLHPADALHDRRCGMATFTSVWGLAVVAMAVLDHRLLARTLRPARPEAEPGAGQDAASREAAG